MNRMIAAMLVCVFLVGMELPVSAAAPAGGNYAALTDASFAALTDTEKMAAILAAAKGNKPKKLKAFLKAFFAGKTAAQVKALAGQILTSTLGSGNTPAEIQSMVALVSGGLIVTSGDNAGDVAGVVATSLAGTTYLGAGVAAIVLVTNNDPAIVGSASAELTGSDIQTFNTVSVAAADAVDNEVSILQLQNDIPVGNQYGGQQS